MSVKGNDNSDFEDELADFIEHMMFRQRQTEYLDLLSDTLDTSNLECSRFYDK